MIKMDTQTGLSGGILQDIKRYQTLRMHLLYHMQLVRMEIPYDTQMWMKEVVGITERNQGFGIGKWLKTLMTIMVMVYGIQENISLILMEIISGTVLN